MGVASPVIKSNRFEFAKISMYATDPGGNYFGEKEFHNTVLHEAGHTLGIMGHSYSPDDIMHMSSEGENLYTAHRSAFQYLSERDLNTVRLLYRLDESIYPPIALGTDSDINKRKIREAQHYIKEAPRMASGYVDLSAAYAQDKQYDKAIEALNAAYILSANNDERYLVLYNMAVTYLNKQDLANALEYAKKAQNLNDNEQIRRLIEHIEK